MELAGRYTGGDTGLGVGGYHDEEIGAREGNVCWSRNVGNLNSPGLESIAGELEESSEESDAATPTPLIS